MHALMWPIVGGSWEDSLSIRKPILFGVSAGVTTWSVGWVVSKLNAWRSDFVLASMFAASIVLEVAIITLQYWRGVPSHFNYTSAFDSFLTSGMNLFISIVVTIVMIVGARSLGRLDCESDERFAIRCGMLLLIVGCGIGFVISAYGDYRTAAGLDPETFGRAGVVKFPHGMPLHAIQLLAFWVWLQSHCGITLRLRTLSVKLAGAGFWLATIFSAVQTLAGRARYDLDSILGLTLFLAAAACIGAACLLPLVMNRNYLPVACDLQARNPSD